MRALSPRAVSTPPARRIAAAATTPPAHPPRRAALAAGGAALLAGLAGPASAVGFKKELRKKRYLLPDDYTSPPVDGLPSLELEAGRSGPPASLGDTVTVHFDVVWRGIDVSSSRAARLLGANRSLPEPYTFVVGAPVTAAAARKASGEGGGGGLFAGGAGPQPPAALSTAVVGMRVGGKRAVLVPAGERGYGDKRVGEAPPGVDLELRIEVLDVAPKAG